MCTPTFLTKKNFATIYHVNNGSPYSIGETLGARSLTLKEGEELGLIFHTGARVDIQGPGTYSIDGDHSMTVKRGLLSARMDGSKGTFIVDTDEGRIVDLGTFFTVARPSSGLTEVHVHEGLVRVEQGKDTMLVHEEQAMHLTDSLMAPDQYLKQRYASHLDLRFLDQDGDGVDDNTELELGTSPNHAQSFPAHLRIYSDLTGQTIGDEILIKNDNFVLRGGKVSKGLTYHHGHYKLVTHPLGIQTGSTSKYFECQIQPLKGCLPSKGKIYISYLMRLENPIHFPEQAYAGLSFLKTDLRETFFAGDLWNKKGFGINSNESLKIPNEKTLIDVLDQKTHLFVLEIDYTRKLTKIWIDPSLDPDTALPKESFLWHGTIDFRYFGLRSGLFAKVGGYLSIFDEFRVGLSRESVLPVEPIK